MRATEFVTAYANRLDPDQIHAGPHSTYIRDAQAWSYRFGLLLHATLSETTPPADAMDRKGLDDYKHWMAFNWARLRWRGEDAPEEDCLRVFSETTFHHMNWHTTGIWKAILAGGWTPKERQAALTDAREGIAAEGVALFKAREGEVTANGSPELFTKENKGFFGAFNGALQAFDSGVVLTGIAARRAKRDPGFMFVPAPLQFERGLHSQYNSNFIAFRLGEQAIGIQTKSSVHSTAVHQYDPSRVVLLDGQVDFDNVRALRTSTQSSHQQVVSWSGMVCAEILKNIPLQGRDLQLERRRKLIQSKMIALGALGKTKVPYQRIISRIEPRILEKLQAETV
jgi:hypothetical protein